MNNNNAAQTVVERLLGEEDNAFVAEVALELDIRGLEDPDRYWDVVAPKRVRVPFEIDLEYRSWGISGATITARGVLNIEVELEDAEAGERRPLAIKVELSKLEHDKQPGPLTIHQLNIQADKNGVVDYQASNLECFEF